MDILLPNEIWFNIFYYCDISSLYNIGLCDNKCKKLIKEFIRLNTKTYYKCYKSNIIWLNGRKSDIVWSCKYKYIDLANTIFYTRFHKFIYYHHEPVVLTVDACNNLHGDYYIYDINHVILYVYYVYGYKHKLSISYYGSKNKPNVYFHGSKNKPTGYFYDDITNNLGKRVHKGQYYKRGIKHGECYSYHYNGTTREKYCYKYGKRHGLYKQWNDIGKLYIECEYKHGSIVGPCRFYDIDKTTKNEIISKYNMPFEFIDL